MTSIIEESSYAEELREMGFDVDGSWVTHPELENKYQFSTFAEFTAFYHGVVAHCDLVDDY